MKKEEKKNNKKKPNFISKTRMKNNIRKVWDEMSWAFFDENKDWYWVCHKWCQELADEKDVPLMCVVGVFSAMSPQCSYGQNKNFCRLYFEGIRKHTFTQHGKADKIAALYGIDSYELRKEQIVKYLGGSKTQNFFLNILEPFGKTACTIDRHALVIAGVEKPTVTPVQYEKVKEAYIEVARELEVLPAELQASTWVFSRLQKYPDERYD